MKATNIIIACLIFSLVPFFWLNTKLIAGTAGLGFSALMNCVVTGLAAAAGILVLRGK